MNQHMMMNQPAMNQPMTMNQAMEQKVCDENCENDCCKDKNEYDDDEYDDDEYHDDEEDYGSEDKWKYSLYSAIVFLLISSPYTYMLMNSLFGSVVAVSSSAGCPTIVGLLLHALVFMLIIRGMMELDI
jgi:hypothetical protein